MKGFLIDGEIAGKSWEQTMTLFRSSKADVSKALEKDGRYKIFDLVNPSKLDEPLRDRRERLEEMFSKLKHPQIVLAKVDYVSSYEEFNDIHQFHLASGCDGSIIKLLNSPYEFKRSKYWWKVKPLKTIDCKIVGFNEGKKKYVGMLGSLQVRIPISAGKWSEKISNVSGMSDADREYMWKNRKRLLNTIVEVEYRKISSKGKFVEGHVYRPRPDKD